MKSRFRLLMRSATALAVLGAVIVPVVLPAPAQAWWGPGAVVGGTLLGLGIGAAVAGAYAPRVYYPPPVYYVPPPAYYYAPPPAYYVPPPPPPVAPAPGY